MVVIYNPEFIHVFAKFLLVVTACFPLSNALEKRSVVLFLVVVNLWTEFLSHFFYVTDFMYHWKHIF